ncbi:glycoside hydrolase family protein [Methylocystis sp. JAN1]|uniref:glycoside hydrolase family protein n=1 Tax=Methylocystis sp. JAN1 TaxID=3397211 RepID=UPI003FA26D21
MATHRLDYQAFPSVNPAGLPDAKAHVPTNAETFGASIGQAEEGFGRALEHAGAQVLDTSRIFNQVAGDDGSRQFTQAADKIGYGDPNTTIAGPDGKPTPDLGYFGLKGAAALNARKDAEEKLGTLYSSIRDGLPSEEAKRHFDVSAQRSRAMLSERIAAHANREASVYYASVNKATSDANLNAISRAPMDEGAVALATDNLIRARVKQAQLDGGTDENIDQAVSSARQDALKARVLTISATDPLGAKKLLEANRETAGLEFQPLYDHVRVRAEEQEAIGRAAATFDKMRQQAQIPAGGGDAAAMLRHFESFKSQPYWDVNHWRVGYGSDTITHADGRVETVTPFTTVTREDAERDLQRRIGATQRDIQTKIGPDAWARLSPQAQASLTSTAYNYGHLPDSVAAAVRTGDQSAISTAISALATHNNGVNAKRRLLEANNVLGGFGVGGQQAVAAAPMRQMPASLSGTLGQAPAPVDRPAMVAQSVDSMKAAAVQDIVDQQLPFEIERKAVHLLNQRFNEYAELNTGLSSKISDAQRQIVAGYDVPEPAWNAMASAVSAHGTLELREQFDTAAQIRDKFRVFKGQTPQEIAATIERQETAARAGGASHKEFQILEAGQNYLHRLASDLSKDQMGRAARDGVVTGMRPLDARNPQQFGDALVIRVGQAERVAQFYGVPLKYLRPDEAAAFQEIAAVGGPQMQALASTVIEKLGPKAPAFFNEVGGAAPQFAQMGRLQLLGADQTTLSDLATFQRLVSDKEGARQIPKLPEGVVQENARASYQTAFQAMPGFADSARSAAQKLIEVRALRSGVDPKDMPPADVAKAYQEAAGASFENAVQYGGVGKYKPSLWASGQQVPLPVGVRADRFSDLVGALRDEDFAAAPPVYGDMRTPVPMDALRKGNLVAAGHGAYWVAMGDPHGSDPRWVMARDGGKFLLDLNALEGALRARVPAAYRPQLAGVVQ